MKQSFFSHGRFLGSREIPTYTQGLDGLKVTNSYAIFCPTCGEVWGRLLHEHWGAYSQVITRYCRDHARGPDDGYLSLPNYGGLHPLPGMGIESDWPVKALHHEFLTALSHHSQGEPA